MACDWCAIDVDLTHCNDPEDELIITVSQLRDLMSYIYNMGVTDGSM